MTLHWPAFILGLLGSFHCVVMCSPLMLSFPFQSRKSLSVFYHGLFYQIGRITSYVAIGLVFFFVGKSFDLVNLQNSLSILVGMLFLFAAIVSFTPKLRQKFSGFALLVIKPSKWNALISGRSTGGIKKYLLGILNGFLPCGLVYAAAISTVLMPSFERASINMIAFGLGTLPIMMAVLLVKLKMKSFGSRIQALTPFVLGFLGLYFILRGMELNIPYISPVLPSAADSVANCTPI